MAGRHDESTLKTPERYAYAQALLDWSRTLEGPWPRYDDEYEFDHTPEEVHDVEVHVS